MYNRNTNRKEVLKSLNILVVDDIAAVRSVLTEILRELGVGGCVDTAEDGLKAWEMVQVNNYDIVISDILMPRMNGLELRKLMRATHRFSNLPFLIITGEISERVVAQVLESEKDGYLLKPFPSVLLEKRILQLLGKADVT
jgi:CheY-like chemotaxis protein